MSSEKTTVAIKVRKRVLALLPIFGVLLLWEVIVRVAAVDRRLFPTPSAVILAAGQMIRAGEFGRDLAMSVVRALIGFGAGTIAGLTVGLLTGRSRVGHFLLTPILQSLRSIPSIAVLPLAILFLGLDERTKYFLIFWGVFFPVWMNSHIGISGVAERYLWVAHSLGAGRRHVLLEVVLPAATPLIVAGMRVGIGLAFLNLVAAEMSGAAAGLGYRVTASHLVFRTDRMLVAIATLGALGAIADALFQLIASKLVPWYRDGDAT